MVEQNESPKKFNMKKVTIVDEEEARNTRKSRPKQTRKNESTEHDDSDDSGKYLFGLLKLMFNLFLVYQNFNKLLNHKYTKN